METNVVNPLMKGYYFNLFFKPSISNKFRLGIGTYGLQTPSLVVHVKSCSDNVNVGFTKGNLIIHNSFNFQLEYFPAGIDKKWFVGEQLSFLTYRITNVADVWSGKLNTSSLLTYAGFIRRFGNSRFYMKPWVGIGFLKITGKRNVINSTYELNRVSYVMVGVNFSMYL